MTISVSRADELRALVFHASDAQIRASWIREQETTGQYDRLVDLSGRILWERPRS